MHISTNITQALATQFPLLSRGSYAPKSVPTTDYNCIAFAAGDISRWWWPFPGYFWPPNVPRAETLETFVALFESIGFTEHCDLSDLGPGRDRVAVFTLSGKPKHAARQSPTGRWASKLGACLDLTHPLHALEGPLYGQVTVILARPLHSSSATNGLST